MPSADLPEAIIRGAPFDLGPVDIDRHDMPAFDREDDAESLAEPPARRVTTTVLSAREGRRGGAASAFLHARDLQ